MNYRYKLRLEFFIIFIFIPFLFISKIVPLVFIMFALWAVAIYTIWVLKLKFKDIYYLDLKFDGLKDIFYKFLFIGFLIVLFTFFFYPDKFFGFIVEKPFIFIVIVILYPLLSVVPQELIFRKFFFERYGYDLSNDIHLWINAFIFGFMHMVFGNLLAVVFTVLGGYIFAARYREHGTLFPVYLEHTLYGLFVFTLGLGEFFYHGR